MNWSMVAAVLAGMAFTVTLARIVFFDGKRSQQLDDLAERQSLHGNRLDGHDVAINKLALESAESRGWRAGFKIATEGTK